MAYWGEEGWRLLCQKLSKNALFMSCVERQVDFCGALQGGKMRLTRQKMWYLFYQCYEYAMNTYIPLFYLYECGLKCFASSSIKNEGREIFM